MKPPETRPPTTAAVAVVPALPEFRDWSSLPELPLSEVLRHLLPCLRSVYAIAAVCRPWRRTVRPSAAIILRPGVPPLLLDPRSRGVSAFSNLVLAQPLAYQADLLAEGAILMSASRGRLLLRRRGPAGGEAHLIIIDALTGGERRELTLPSPRFTYHYAALLPNHLLVFHSKHAFFSLPFPDPNPNPLSSSTGPNWTQHSLPRSASFVTGVVEFRGRVLGLTDRAQLLEFRLGDSPQGHTVQVLPADGLPDATTFDRWRFGPRLAAAGDRLLLVLFMLQPKWTTFYIQQKRRVKKVAVYGLDFARMRWEEVENIGAYSLFVDCAGNSAAACIDVGSCGVEENRVYVAAPGCRWRSFPPGWEESPGDANNGLFRSVRHRHLWPSLTWVYPPLFY
ncbi:hypothetical protein HU200_017733 [Digitaria exilis]|uniref:KIB1-4 beta-propeller domain-containing protein n=1 Tax=Digitaria exilis TaxID=1010633 RepID=A0A835F706_9POAL|nr:hypothetical protein HU200_017733 [Digitaria exilis]